MSRIDKVLAAAPAGVLAGRGLLAAFEVGALGLGDTIRAATMLLKLREREIQQNKSEFQSFPPDSYKLP